jgi:hypothetical protein
MRAQPEPRAYIRVAHIIFLSYTKHHGREITLCDVKPHTKQYGRKSQTMSVIFFFFPAQQLAKALAIESFLLLGVACRLSAKVSDDACEAHQCAGT